MECSSWSLSILQAPKHKSSRIRSSHLWNLSRTGSSLLSTKITATPTLVRVFPRNRTNSLGREEKGGREQRARGREQGVDMDRRGQEKGRGEGRRKGRRETEVGRGGRIWIGSYVCGVRLEGWRHRRANASIGLRRCLVNVGRSDVAEVQRFLPQAQHSPRPPFSWWEGSHFNRGQFALSPLI